MTPAVLWRHLFLDSEDAQLICDNEGLIAEVNREAAARLGLDRGTRLAQCGLLKVEALAAVHSVLSGSTAQPFTLPGVALPIPGGGTRIVDLKIAGLSAGCWLLTCKDASRRLHLETHTQRLLAAIDSTPDVVILTDQDYRITFVNPAFEAAAGYVIEDVVGRTVDAFHAPHQEDKIKEYKDGARRGADWVGELVMQRRDGSAYPVDMSFSPVHDGQGHFIGGVAFQRDISGRKKLQDALLMERNFARSIINSLDASLYTLDGRLRLTHFNNGWKRMTGEHGWLRFESEPQVGRCLLDFVVDEPRRGQLEKAFHEVLAEGRPQELQSVDPSGRHWVMSVFPWHHDGRIRGLIYRVTDNSALAGVQQQLFQAQKMSTLGALVAGVAHDFNNLLLAMRGNLSLATMEAQLSTEVRARLQQVDDATVRATDLSRQLLAFSRPAEENVMVLDFNQVIKEAGDMARRVLRSRVKLILNPTLDPLKVQLDRTQAIQILLNLCINALDAMPNGGSLTVSNGLVDLTDEQKARTRRPRSATQFMRCSVTDTGSGIHPEILPRIFTPFFTTKAVGKGTGLGLSIVSNVVSKSGGFIEVDSKVGVGTTFHIYLPLESGPLTKTDTEMRQQICRGTGRLLVVDDLDLVLEFAANFLKQAGYQVLTANSADAAMKVLSQQKLPFDLLFTDYTMPGRNGWQLIQEVMSRWPLTRFVLASGYIDDAERAEIQKAPNVRLLSKPYGIHEATKIIADALSEK
ncbi:MAG TPA: PAS domain S-box protein [Verrucomicrobiae bacterium]|nr:PAS domain S-box protein [Verrucomicrobiae bacterium]